MCGYISGVALQNVTEGKLMLGLGDSTLTCDGGVSDLKSLRCVSFIARRMYGLSLLRLTVRA